MSKGGNFRKSGKLRFIHSDFPTKSIIPSDKVNPVLEEKKEREFAQNKLFLRVYGLAVKMGKIRGYFIAIV
jgi:hypothetical protein